MSKENIVFKDSRQKETVDKHGFIIRKSKKSHIDIKGVLDW